MQPYKPKGMPKGGWPSQIAKREREANPPALIAQLSPTYSFSLEHEGQNLWRVLLIEINKDDVVKTIPVSAGDTKANALRRLHHCAYQLWINERLPESTAEIVPTQSVSHG